jgi:hypothetical protein
MSLSAINTAGTFIENVNLRTYCKPDFVLGQHAKLSQPDFSPMRPALVNLTSHKQTSQALNRKKHAKRRNEKYEIIE